MFLSENEAMKCYYVKSCCVFVSVLIYLCPLFQAQDVFIDTPSDTLGYAGQQVSLKCSIRLIHHDRILWYLNGETPPSQPSEPYWVSKDASDYDDGESQVLISFLTMAASPETNGTRIVCKASSRSSPSKNAESVHLTVQGILSAPEVSYVNDSQSVSMALVKPFSLPGANVSHYGYRAHIPSLNFTYSSNFTEPHFSFVFSEHTAISRCEDQYITFSVCAYNPAGEGEFTNVTVLIPADSQYYIIASGVAAGSVLIVVLATSVMLCLVIGYRRLRKGKSVVHVESSPKHMALNAAYAGTYPMIRNAAYEHVKEPPHTYEQVDIEPKYATVDDSLANKTYANIQDA